MLVVGLASGEDDQPSLEKRFRRPRALDRARGRRTDCGQVRHGGMSPAACTMSSATHINLGWARSRRAPSKTGVV